MAKDEQSVDNIPIQTESNNGNLSERQRLRHEDTGRNGEVCEQKHENVSYGKFRPTDKEKKTQLGNVCSVKLCKEAIVRTQCDRLDFQKIDPKTIIDHYLSILSFLSHLCHFERRQDVIGEP